ncbi:hypothetical protein TCAL_11662 [Tigriopus californicus]|uniref:Exonuclease domain-containing protein n=1 Tax=Tigriopus californicus TaxID=6832 RepID=A0A553NAS8_TIGCA|nr:hypothetical protein TCAL_11662 [Tigriopus californicus]|eukprot:TCALIF_11662-PA protein Name:"Similar to ERI2 ERI1 exoribonuclease 2 (Homo sapiens)" AED:0.02 eAED:0.02 QI:163/1/1/1/1/1/2/798/195
MTSSPTPSLSLIPSASRPPGPTGSGSRTLAMAQSMGLVRSRSLQNRSCPKPSLLPRSSPVMSNGFAGFSFLIVIDFESTCWAEKGPGCFPPEIIEFPAVLLDTQTGHILDEFHSYVLPTETPQLSEFCTQLTGIRQDQVDTQGVPLPTCLYLFAQWMRKIQTHWNIVLHETRLGFRSTTFVTWYVFPLRSSLPLC